MVYIEKFNSALRFFSVVGLIILLNLALRTNADLPKDEIVKTAEEKNLSELKNNIVVFTGELVSKIKNQNRIDHKTSRLYAAKLSYKEGGITFVYPDKYFTEKPCIYTSLELNKLEYSTDLKISPIITSHNNLSTTVFVNKQISGLIKNYVNEANTDDVDVNIFAFGY